MDQETLKEWLRYDPDTGVFYWRKAKQGVAVGVVAGCIGTHGYRQIRFNRKLYLAHRLAWLYCFSEFPENEIDHINGVTTDNRIINLRAVDRKENNKNRKLSINSKTGVLGVSYIKSKNNYQVHIHNVWLATTKDFFEACCIRKSAEVKHNYHINHGRAN